MRLRLLAVGLVATLGLVAGCSGSEPGATPGPATAASSAPSSADPATSTPAPTASSASPSAVPPSSSASQPVPGNTDLNGANGKLTWVMPCGNPRDQELEGNAEDKKTYAGFHAWACGEGATASAGVVVAELQKEPADAAAARRQLATAMKQITGGGDATAKEFFGHPGLTQKVDRDGRSAAYQGVSFDRYLAFFFVIPAKDLSKLTDTITIS